MDFMGIGPLEVLLVLIIGFLLLGPDKLPGMAAKAGQLYRNFKKATFDLTKAISEDVSSEKKTISEDLSSISKAITEDLSFENKAENDVMTASEAES
ncbi:MAG: twin-arginine translocase TatA/TatE family subunit, partial [Dehalococcoidia bacterium]|nr:twin-arginine translocase TatA/TatE family subunit [Dehalococcoidia bacterium]